MEMSINEYVWVELTSYGEEMYKIYYTGKLNVEAPPLDVENGWAKFQLWDLMRIFGRQCGNGMPNQFEDCIIRFSPSIG